MRLQRLVKGGRAPRFPQMSAMFAAGGRDAKNDLLVKWVKSGENAERMEATLSLQAKSSQAHERKSELLTVAQMRARGMSEPLAWHSVCCAHVWHITALMRVTQPRTKVEAIVRKGGGVPDLDAPTSAADMQYWVQTSCSRTEQESVEQSATLQGEVDAQDALSTYLAAPPRLEALAAPRDPSASAPAIDAVMEFVKGSANAANAGWTLVPFICRWAWVPLICLAPVRV